jgi:hypothetical protein
MRRAPASIAAVVIAASAVLAAEIPQGERRSGFSFMAPETQAMQNDDTANPGMLWVLEGEALWNSKSGASGKGCGDCHNDARSTMKGVAARYPAFDKGLGRRPRRAHQHLPNDATAGNAACLRKPGTAGAHRVPGAAIARDGNHRGGGPAT